MHWLLLGLYGAVHGLISFLVQWMTKKVAITVAIVTVWVAITVAFTAAIDLAFSQIGSMIPPGFAAGAYGLLPGNIPFCLGILAAAHLAAAVYKSKEWLLQMHAAGG